MRIDVQAAVFALLISVGHAQNVSGPGTNSSTTFTPSSKTSGLFLTVIVIAAFLLLFCVTAWGNLRRRTRAANVNGAPQQPAPEKRLEELKPEPFIPIVVVSPDNEVVIGRQVDAPQPRLMHSPFQQTAEEFQSQLSNGRGRLMPQWLAVLSRQRSTASMDDIEAQKGDASFSSRSAAMRANSSRLASLRRLGSSLITRQSSGNTALDDQMVSAPPRMPESDQDKGGRE